MSKSSGTTRATGSVSSVGSRATSTGSSSKSKKSYTFGVNDKELDELKMRGMRALKISEFDDLMSSVPNAPSDALVVSPNPLAFTQEYFEEALKMKKFSNIKTDTFTHNGKTIQYIYGYRSLNQVKKFNDEIIKSRMVPPSILGYVRQTNRVPRNYRDNIPFAIQKILDKKK